jgi:hypothetical protein
MAECRRLGSERSGPGQSDHAQSDGICLPPGHHLNMLAESIHPIRGVGIGVMSPGPVLIQQATSKTSTVKVARTRWRCTVYGDV